MKVTWQPSAAKLSNEALKERSCSASSGRKMRTKYLPPTSSVFRSNTLTDFVLVHLDHVVEGEDVLWSTVTMTFSLRVLEVTGTYISLGSVCICFNRVFTFFNKKDDLVNFHLLTILRGQGHISKVIVLKFLKAQLCHSYWPNISSEKYEEPQTFCQQIPQGSPYKIDFWGSLDSTSKLFTTEHFRGGNFLHSGPFWANLATKFLKYSL